MHNEPYNSKKIESIDHRKNSLMKTNTQKFNFAQTKFDEPYISNVFLGLIQAGKYIYALSVRLNRQGIPTNVLLVLSTGKVSHWKAQKKSTIKP